MDSGMKDVEGKASMLLARRGSFEIESPERVRLIRGFETLPKSMRCFMDVLKEQSPFAVCHAKLLLSYQTFPRHGEVSRG